MKHVYVRRPGLTFSSWTLVTSCFSHQDPIHFFMNSLAIYWMAPPVLQLLGPVPFMTFYIASTLSNHIRQKKTR